MRTDMPRRERVAMLALADQLERNPRLTRLVVEDYQRASDTAHTLRRRLSAIGPGVVEDRAAHLASGGSEHLQPPGSVDDTGFSDGLV